MMRQSSEPYGRVCDADVVLTSNPMWRLCARLSDMSRSADKRY
jgi:hypothetical protein